MRSRTTSRTYHRRLKKLSPKILRRPIARHLVDAAFEIFRTTGELPDDQRLSHAVTMRAKQGPQITQLLEDESDDATIMRYLVNMPERPKDEILDRLYDEAVFATEPIQWFGRTALIAMADVGLDVTEPLFGVGEGRIKLTIPHYEPVGMHLMGFVDSVTIRPYTAQARRLFARFDCLRKEVPQEDATWIRAADKACESFLSNGALPDNELMQAVVLAEGELLGLVRNLAGLEDRELMAAFDKAARSSGDERKAAVGTIQRLVAEW